MHRSIAIASVSIFMSVRLLHAGIETKWGGFKLQLSVVNH